MKYLFVHQNFPGQFLHLVRHLLRAKQHDVVFICEPNANQLQGVRKVVYKVPRAPSPDTFRVAQEFEAAALRAESVAATATSVKALGYTPDIIIGHHGWGELLNIGDVWPDVPLLGYFEYFYRLQGADVGFDPEFPTPPADFARIRAKNAVNLLALALDGHGQTPTAWQHSTYPDWARSRITVLPEGVDLDVCKPDPAAHRRACTVRGVTIGARDKLVTYVARDLEPYRGFHVVMRALPALLDARRDLRVVIVGGDGISYGARLPDGTTWRERMLAELDGRLDLSRVHFMGKVDYASYLTLLQRSDAHLYFSYPFVASWSLREALAIGCAVVAGDTPTVSEFIADGVNGRLTPFFDPQAAAARVLEILDDPALSRALRAGARRYAEAHLAMADYIGAYEALIGKLTGTG